MAVNLDLISLTRFMPQFSDERLARSIEKLEAKAREVPGFEAGLKFALDERARRAGVQTSAPSRAIVPKAPPSAILAAKPATPPAAIAPGPAPATELDPEQLALLEAEAAAVARRAQELVFEAQERGEQLELVEAVRMAREGEDPAKRPEGRAHELMAQAAARGEHLDHADALRLASLPAGHDEVVAFKARQKVFDAGQRGEYLDFPDAVAQVRRGW